MRFLSRRPYPILGLVTTLIALATLVPVVVPSLVYAGEGNASLAPAASCEIAAASLVNPGFDNGQWDYFSYVPGGTPAFVPRYWHIWYKDGTIPFYTRNTGKHVDGKEAVRGHAYWNEAGGKLEAGLYQVIDDTTPCLTYEFQMYGQSIASEGDDVLHGMSVGIHRTGYSPDDVAVPGDDFDQIAWGTSKSNCTEGWCLVTVTADAWADQITVFTYADASGGDSHDVVWDAGDLDEVTADLISDPDNPPAASGISGLAVNAARTSATINWSTSAEALGQVYYRLVSGPTTPVSPTTGLTNTIYLPLISRAPIPWSVTTLNKSPATSHSVQISGLQANSTYEYIAASRGLSSGQCKTWVSGRKEFTTAP